MNREHLTLRYEHNYFAVEARVTQRATKLSAVFVSTQPITTHASSHAKQFVASGVRQDY